MTTEQPRHIRLFELARKVIEGLFAHRAFDHAATMAFYFFLGSIPLMVFAGLLVGNVVEREGAERLAEHLFMAMPSVAASLFQSELRQIGRAHAHSVAPLSLLGFLWLTTNGIHNLMDVFEVLVGVRPRSWWRQRRIAILWVAAALGGLAATTWLLLLLNGAANGIERATHIPSLLRWLGDSFAESWKRAGVVVLFSGLLSIALAVFYRTAVKHPVGMRRRVWPGTFVALFSWMLVSWAFGTYVKTIGHYAIYYGSLATVAVILLWLYLTSLALVLGAEVNAQLEGVRDRPTIV